MGKTLLCYKEINISEDMYAVAFYKSEKIVGYACTVKDITSVLIVSKTRWNTPGYCYRRSKIAQDSAALDSSPILTNILYATLHLMIHTGENIAYLIATSL